MKNYIYTAVLASFMMIGVSSANPVAENFFFKPYVGATINRYDIDYKNIPNSAFSFKDFSDDTLYGFGVNLGARIHKHAGIELSYLRALKETKTSTTGVVSSNYGDGFMFDLMGYYPIPTTKIELIASVGAAYTTYIGKSSNSLFNVDTDELKFRFGGGVQYALSDSLRIRGMIHYHDAEYAGKAVGLTDQGTANSTLVSSIGLNWQF